MAEKTDTGKTKESKKEREVSKVKGGKKLEEEKGIGYALFHNLPLPASLSDPAGVRTDVNEACLTLYKRKKKEWIGAKLEEMYEKVDAPKIRKAVEDCKKVGHGTCEVTAIRGDGTKFPVILNFSTLKDKKGEVSHMVCTATDVTELRKREETIEDARRFAENLFNVNPHPLSLNTLEGKKAWVNDAFADYFKVSKEEVKGMAIEEFYKEKDRIKTAIADAKEEGISSCEATAIKADGSTSQVLLHFAPIKNEKGQITYLFATVMDISKLKEAEREMEEAKLYAERLIRNTPVPIILYSPEGLVTDCNPATELLSGRKREELLDTKVEELYEEDSRKDAKGLLTESMEKDSASKELLLHNKKGKSVPVMSHAAVIRDISGKPVGVVNAISNITAIKEREQELTDGMEQFGEAFGRISGGDLEARVEIRKLGSGLRVMGDHLNRVLATMDKNFKDLQNSKETADKERSNLARAVKEINEVLSKAAKGELTQKVNVDALSEDLKEVGENINGMEDAISNLIMQAMQTSEEVRETCKTILSSAEGVSASSQQMTNAIQQISKGASDQANLSTNIKQGSDKLKKITQSVLSGVRTTAEKINAIAGESREGEKYAGNAAEGSRAIAQSFDTVAKKIEELGKSIEKITSVTKVITDIADQTNLLALNAAIEAARAGEHGRAFAVVADEIRRLASGSKESVQQITSMIETMEREKGETVLSANKSISSVNEGRKTIENALNILQGIPSIVEETASIAQEIRQQTEEEAKSVEEIDKQIAEVSLIAEENAAATQETSASTEELMASMEELTAISERLGNAADELKVSLERFKIK